MGSHFRGNLELLGSPNNPTVQNYVWKLVKSYYIFKFTTPNFQYKSVTQIDLLRKPSNWHVSSSSFHGILKSTKSRLLPCFPVTVPGVFTFELWSPWYASGAILETYCCFGTWVPKVEDGWTAGKHGWKPGTSPIVQYEIYTSSSTCQLEPKKW